MNIIDAKIINTESGVELYNDELPLVEFKEIHSPMEDEPYYELTVGVNYYRLRPPHYYEGETGYFKIRMNPELNVLTIIETDRGSLFAIKNDKERAETKKLVAEWLIGTSSFQKQMKDLIVKKKIEKNGEIKSDLKQTVEFLMKVQEIKPRDILNAAMEKEGVQPFCWAM